MTPKESPKKGLVIFVEGQTEKVFYERIINHIKGTFIGKVPLSVIKIKNIKGIGKYNTKAVSKFKNEILRDYPGVKFTVVCAYDSDVFDYSPKPPVDWKKVECLLKQYGAARVVHIKAVRMIEDWFLVDIAGLCKYLRINPVPQLKGKTGLDKIQNIFRKKNKVYEKGYYCDDFISNLDLHLLMSRIVALAPLNKLLFK